MKDEREWIEVTWGPMTFTPAAYSSFKVGPFSARVEVQPDESPEDAIDKAMAVLRKKGELEFKATALWFKGALANMANR